MKSTTDCPRHWWVNPPTSIICACWRWHGRRKCWPKCSETKQADDAEPSSALTWVPSGDITNTWQVINEKWQVVEPVWAIWECTGLASLDNEMGIETTSVFSWCYGETPMCKRVMGFLPLTTVLHGCPLFNKTARLEVIQTQSLWLQKWHHLVVW